VSIHDDGGRTPAGPKVPGKQNDCLAPSARGSKFPRDVGWNAPGRESNLLRPYGGEILLGARWNVNPRQLRGVKRESLDSHPRGEPRLPMTEVPSIELTER